MMTRKMGVGPTMPNPATVATLVERRSVCHADAAAIQKLQPPVACCDGGLAGDLPGHQAKSVQQQILDMRCA